MNKCHVCNASESQAANVNELFHIEEKSILVENIPALVCYRCGEVTFSAETTEKIRVMLHENHEFLKAEATNVFSYPSPKKKRLSGAMKGTFILPLPDNFDEPLEDFKDYM